LPAAIAWRAKQVLVTESVYQKSSCRYIIRKGEQEKEKENRKRKDQQEKMNRRSGKRVKRKC
jgi:hypothetical protein